MTSPLQQQKAVLVESPFLTVKIEIVIISSTLVQDIITTSLQRANSLENFLNPSEFSLTARVGGKIFLLDNGRPVNAYKFAHQVFFFTILIFS